MTLEIGGRDISVDLVLTPERLATVLAIVTERWPESVVQKESGSPVPSAIHIHRDAQTFEWAEAEGVTDRVAPNLISLYPVADFITFVRADDNACPGAQLVAAILEALSRVGASG
jgi:hypothetical protein